ncbi:MAG: hypothetical protein IPJ19_15035 [Planctomycetes bacterium]|nr:hypothetical protein [Planctomycetota bacterium]
MKFPLPTALLALALLVAPTHARVHGNNIPPPPGGPTSPGSSPAGPSGPSTPAPSGPSTPTPGAATPRPTGPSSTPAGGAPRTPGGSGSTGPQSGADARFLDPTWDLWWHFHKDEFFDLKRRVYESVTTPDGLGRGESLLPGANLGYRPSSEQLARDVAPLFATLLAKEHNNELVTSTLLAAGRLGEIPDAGEAARLAPLCARLLRDPNQEIAEIAALSLGLLGSESNLALLEGLLRDDAAGREAAGTREVPMRMRSFAAFGLGVLGQHLEGNRPRQMIARALTDQLARREGCTTDTRAACLIALGLVPLELEREESASAPWLSRQTELRFLLEFVNDGEQTPVLRAHAANALAELACGSTPEAKIAVLDALIALSRRDSTQATLRESCLMGLGRLADDDQDPEDKRARVELRRTFASGSTSERAFALMSLSECAARAGTGLEPGSARSECRDVLAEELAHGRSRTRPWAALALGVLEFRLQHQGAQPLPAVRDALRRALAGAAGPDEAGACAVAIGLTGDADGARVLAERLAGAGDDVLRGYFALGIGLSGNHSLTEGVRTVTASARYRPFLMQQCVVALALLGDKNLAPGLAQDLRSATGQASQSWLAQALGMVGDSRTVPVLVAMVREQALTDSARGNLASALGIVCDKDLLPWYRAFSAHVNWRAATSTLIAGNGTGILEIL